MMRIPPSRVGRKLGFVAALCLVVAGCTGGDDDESSEATNAETSDGPRSVCDYVSTASLEQWRDDLDLRDGVMYQSVDKVGSQVYQFQGKPTCAAGLSSHDTTESLMWGIGESDAIPGDSVDAELNTLAAMVQNLETTEVDVAGVSARLLIFDSTVPADPDPQDPDFDPEAEPTLIEGLTSMAMAFEHDGREYFVYARGFDPDVSRDALQSVVAQTGAELLESADGEAPPLIALDDDCLSADDPALGEVIIGDVYIAQSGWSRRDLVLQCVYITDQMIATVGYTIPPDHLRFREPFGLAPSAVIENEYGEHQVIAQPITGGGRADVQVAYHCTAAAEFVPAGDFDPETFVWEHEQELADQGMSIDEIGQESRFPRATDLLEAAITAEPCRLEE